MVWLEGEKGCLMKVSGIQSGIQEVSKVSKTSATKTSKIEGTSPECNSSASVTSSPDAKIYTKGVEAAKAAQTLTQATKVAHLKAQIQAGTYTVHTGKLAEKILKEHLS